MPRGASQTRNPAVSPSQNRSSRSASSAGIDSWLASHRVFIVLALAFASLALRGVYYTQLKSGPCINLHRQDGTDMQYFDAWGRAIANGDWLSASVGVPMHPWHREVAAAYFASDPQVRADLEQESARAADGKTPDERLWARWTGGHQFYQDPLHAYLVGVTYLLTGADPAHVLLWQMLLGVLTNLLIYVIAREYFGDLVGTVAGVMAVLCGPLMHYEGVLLRDSTITCAAVGAVWLTSRALAGHRSTRFAVLGASLGLAVMLKSTFLLLALVLAAGIVVHLRARARNALLAVGTMVIGFALAIAPFAVRNVLVGVPPLALAGSGVLTFVASNGVGYPAFGGFGVDASQMADVLGKSDGRTFAAIVETIRPHTVASLAGLFWDRFAATWHWYEIPNNANFYYFQLRTPVLAWLPATFFVVAPLGLVGLVLGARKFAAAWPLYAAAGCFTVSLVVFLVLGRLRAPLLAALIPFAALTLVTWFRSRRTVVVATVVAVFLLGLWIGRPLPPDYGVIRLTDWLSPFLVQYQEPVKRALDASDPGAAASAYLEFLHYEPDERQLGPNGVPATAEDRRVARTFADIHTACARLLRAAGREEEARSETQIASRWSQIAAR